MGPWDELTLEQYAVMIVAIEEAYLYNVMDEYAARLQWAKPGDVYRSSTLDDEAKRRLIPHFAAVVADLMQRGWIKLTEPTIDQRHDADPITGTDLHDTLHDPAAAAFAGSRRRTASSTTASRAGATTSPATSLSLPVTGPGYATLSRWSLTRSTTTATSVTG